MLLAIKTKNEITRKTGIKNLEFKLRNILINGSKRGCSGFVHNPETDVYVYVNTEKSVYGDMTICRFADGYKDYRGHINHNCWSEDELIKETARLIMADPKDEWVKSECKTV